jgi:hypothetical protein
LDTETAAPLRTGWEPDTAAQNTLAPQALLAHVARAEHTARAAGGCALADANVAVSDVGLPGCSVDANRYRRAGAKTQDQCREAGPAHWQTV